jgi:hypothetical protein
MKKKYKIMILFIIAIVLLLWPITIDNTNELECKDVGMAKVVKNDDH